MKLRWVTAAYLVYLALPIALLFIGSFGDLWLNSLLPSGLTVRWYLEVAADPSFRRAFSASLFVAVATSIACVAIGLPLAYAVFRANNRRVRALARVLYQLPVALAGAGAGLSVSSLFSLRTPCPGSAVSGS